MEGRNNSYGEEQIDDLFVLTQRDSFCFVLLWFAAPDSDLWKELKEEVGCAHLVKKEETMQKYFK